jgi:transposase
MGHTDMRRGMRSLALQVQQGLGRDPFAGDLYIFRGRRGDLCKIIWHDGVGMSLYAKRLERGKYIWPSAVDGENTGIKRGHSSAGTPGIKRGQSC